MVTVPTLDQISGNTVMQKLRSLIENYITFAGDVDGKLTDFLETLNSGSIKEVGESQSGSVVTIALTMNDGSIKTFSFTATTGVTLDTEQTITGKKKFTDIEINGAVDSDVLFDKDITVMGKVGVEGELEVIGDSELSGMAIEKSTDNSTVLSNENGIKVNGHNLNNAVTIDEDQIITSAKQIPTPTSSSPSTQAINKAFVSNTDGVTNNLVHIIADESINGYKSFAYPPAQAAWACGSNNTNGWRKIILSNSINHTANSNLSSVFLLESGDEGSVGIFYLRMRTKTITCSRISGNFNVTNVRITIDVNGQVVIWSQLRRTIGIAVYTANVGEFVNKMLPSNEINTIYSEPIVGETYEVVYTPTV